MKCGALKGIENDIMFGGPSLRNPIGDSSTGCNSYTKFKSSSLLDIISWSQKVCTPVRGDHPRTRALQKNIRKITGNQLPVRFPLLLLAPENIF